MLSPETIVTVFNEKADLYISVVDIFLCFNCSNGIR